MVKLFAKATGIFQAHDVGKSHPKFKAHVKNQAFAIVTSATELLPENYLLLWRFLGDDCHLKVESRRTVWYHMINSVTRLDDAFSPRILKAAYERCGLWPNNFRKFMQRMPGWSKQATEEDTKFLENKLPD